MGFALIGPPIAGLDGLATGATAFGTALQTGNGVAALGALADMPAYGLNGFLNGETIVDLTIPVAETVDPEGDDEGDHQTDGRPEQGVVLVR